MQTMTNEIVINWHILEKCNYKCFYCFAKYGCEASLRKSIKNGVSKDQIKIILHNLYNGLDSHFKDYSFRLNIAGGEPLLSPNLGYIIKEAKSIGFSMSIITNASLLDSNFIESYAKDFSIFGISFDSMLQNTRMQIGRYNKQSPTKNADIIESIRLLRHYNPHIKIKINSVINKLNYKENMSEFIESIKPDKWKVLQALSVHTDEILCEDFQYEYFIKTHAHLKEYMSLESNDDMRHSYIMLDPLARFYQNDSHNGSGYTYSPSLLEMKADEIIKHINVDMIKFAMRYDKKLRKIS